MQIKLIQAIRANGTQHRPPTVVDTKDIGISDAEAEVLVRSGVATVVNAKASKPVETDEQRQAREAAEAQAAADAAAKAEADAKAAADAEAAAKAAAEAEAKAKADAKPAAKKR